MIIFSDDSGPVQWPSSDSHDPLSKKYYYISYKPETRVNSKAYIKDVDIVVPPVFNGCMYYCVSGGISLPTTPTFTTEEGKFLDDGDVRWKTLAYSAKLLDGDQITLSTWTSSIGVTLSDTSSIINGITTLCKVDSVPLNTKKITVTNHITITRSTGKIEEFEKSLVIPIKEL
jgi:hypothetical protein